MKHIPKGSMCLACEHRFRDCSYLDFSSMAVIASSNDYNIVRCADFNSVAEKSRDIKVIERRQKSNQPIPASVRSPLPQMITGEMSVDAPYV